MTTPFEPPRDIWEVNRTLHVNEPLDGDRDPRWVDTEPARGEYSLNQLCRTLGVDRSRREMTAPDDGYYLFCGHRGSGKSTELRRIAHELHDDDLYYVVFVDAAQELDVNNLRYPDVLLHLAGKLMAQLARDDVPVEQVYLRKLQDWFEERVEKTEHTKAFALDARAGVNATIGLPFLAGIFARISTAFKTNTTYKTELRSTLQNHFTDFSDGFNQLITAAEAGIGRRRILFMIDGTDRLSGDDAHSFFVADVHQLQYVHGVFVYCAPVHLAYESNDIRQNFTKIFRLPMIKVANDDGSRHGEGYAAMLEMLHRRAAPELFDSGVADLLIEHSGGHPRDLLQLLLKAHSHAEHDRFDDASARQAVRELATDYRRILTEDDYQLLARIDAARQAPPSSERVRGLLYNLALLEYNDFYWRSHPVIRTTPGYVTAQQDITDADG